MPGPLAGLRVLTTRAAAQEADLHAALLAAGAQPVSFPLVAIEGASDWAPLDAALGRIEAFDAVVFASQNAVRFTLERAQEIGHGECLAVGGPRVACVGPRTAEVAREAGLSVYCVGDGGAQALLDQLVQRLPPHGRRFPPAALGDRA